jgi:hypothetical protein
MRDAALENYVLNHDDYRPLHERYLTIKAEIRVAWRRLRFFEECIKNRRAELQVISFGGNNHGE